MRRPCPTVRGVVVPKINKQTNKEREKIFISKVFKC